MLNKIKEFFFGKPVAPAPEAPYKVEAPVVQESVPAAPAKEVTSETASKPAKAKKASAEKPPAARKPRAKKTPAK